jgi:hypothetical protein
MSLDDTRLSAADELLELRAALRQAVDDLSVLLERLRELLVPRTLADGVRGALLMAGSQPIVLTVHEIAALSDYAATQSKVRTYKIQRDTRNVLLVVNPDGKLYRLSPAANVSPDVRL